MENIFDSAVLINLQIKCWGNTKKIPTNRFNQISNKELSKWVRANKGLIDKEALADIHSIITKTRNIVKDKSLPFPIEGVFLVPKEIIIDLDTELKKAKEAFIEQVEIFVEEYDEYIDAAKEELGEDLFNEEDYPTNIRERFNIDYKFLEMGVPGEIKNVSIKLYEEEKEKFKITMEQTRNECVLYLRQGFLKVVQDISEMLNGFESGERKRMRQETLDKVEDFFNVFQTKNIFKDSELNELIKKARNNIFGLEFEDLKQSNTLREHITENMEEIQKSLEKSITTYKRKLLIKKSN